MLIVIFNFILPFNYLLKKACVDEGEHCSYWEKKGHCNDGYAAYMKENCKKSCDTCPGTTEHIKMPFKIEFDWKWFHNNPIYFAFHNNLFLPFHPFNANSSTLNGWLIEINIPFLQLHETYHSRINFCAFSNFSSI